MNAKIFVVTHKETSFPQNEVYVPIVVGKKDFSLPEPFYKDDTLDNIASKNSSFCELTALYWIWKNVKEYDVVGLCHYRRYLKKKCILGFQGILNKEDIVNDLETYDILLPQRRHFYTKNVEEQYSSADNAFAKDYESLRNLIQKKYPEYYEAFENVSKGHSTYLYNIMIAKKELFDQYCQWLFSILFELEKELDLTNYTVQQKRIFGFLSERLLSVFVFKHQLKVKEYPVVNIENSLWKERFILAKNNVKKCINLLRDK